MLLDVKVQTRARRDEIMGVHDQRLKIRIKAVPVDGKANIYLCNFIANLCKLPKNQIQIVSGEQNTRKTVCIEQAKDINPEIFHRLHV